MVGLLRGGMEGRQVSVGSEGSGPNSLAILWPFPRPQLGP